MQALVELMKEYEVSIDIIQERLSWGEENIVGIDIDFPKIYGKQEWDYVSIPSGSYITIRDIDEAIKKRWEEDK